MSLHLLGAERPAPPAPRPVSVVGIALTLGAGIAGAVLWPAHRVLGFLLSSTIAGGVHEAATARCTWGEAARDIGCGAIAAGASLAFPPAPAAAWVVGRVGAGMLLPGKERALARLQDDGPEVINVRIEAPERALAPMRTS